MGGLLDFEGGGELGFVDFSVVSFWVIFLIFRSFFKRGKVKIVYLGVFLFSLSREVWEVIIFENYSFGGSVGLW